MTAGEARCSQPKRLSCIRHLSETNTAVNSDNARLAARCGLCWSEICANKQLVHQAAMWCVVFWCNSSESRNGAFTIRYSTLSSQAERQREVISNADVWRRMGNLLSSCVGALRMFFSSSPWKETADRKVKTRRHVAEKSSRTASAEVAAQQETHPNKWGCVWRLGSTSTVYERNNMIYWSISRFFGAGWIHRHGDIVENILFFDKLGPASTSCTARWEKANKVKLQHWDVFTTEAANYLP